MVSPAARWFEESCVGKRRKPKIEVESVALQSVPEMP